MQFSKIVLFCDRLEGDRSTVLSLEEILYGVSDMQFSNFSQSSDVLIRCVFTEILHVLLSFKKITLKYFLNKKQQFSIPDSSHSVMINQVKRK